MLTADLASWRKKDVQIEFKPAI